MNRFSHSVLCTLCVMLLPASLAHALPTQVTYADLPNCDPLVVPTDVHELGIAPTFSTLPDELILAVDTTTQLAACPLSDDPGTLNALVQMTNLTTTAWADVWYVADPAPIAGIVGTSISNFDGVVDDIGGTGDRGQAFRIDTIGMNKPLVFESFLLNGIFDPGETWQFIIDDYFNTAGLAPSLFDSLGVASISLGGPPSSGSIIARAVPEPSTWLLLVLGAGGLAVYVRRRTA